MKYCVVIVWSEVIWEFHNIFFLLLFHFHSIPPTFTWGYRLYAGFYALSLSLCLISFIIFIKKMNALWGQRHIKEVVWLSVMVYGQTDNIEDFVIQKLILGHQRPHTTALFEASLMEIKLSNLDKVVNLTWRKKNIVDRKEKEESFETINFHDKRSIFFHCTYMLKILIHIKFHTR